MATLFGPVAGVFGIGSYKEADCQIERFVSHRLSNAARFSAPCASGSINRAEAKVDRP